MENVNRSNRFSLMVFLLFKNYVLIDYILVYFFYNEFKNNSYLVFLLMLILPLIVTILPKRVFDMKLCEVYQKKKLMKVIITLFLVLASGAALYLTSRVLGYFLFEYVNILYFILGMFAVSLVISTMKSKDIIFLSTIPFLVVIPILLASRVLNFSLFNIENVLPIKFEFRMLYLGLILVIFVFDSLISLLSFDMFKTKKKDFIIPNILFFFYTAFELFGLVSLLGSDYFLNYEYVGFLAFRIQSAFKYLGSFDYISIYLLPVTVILKIAFNLSLLNELFSFKKSQKLCFPIITVGIALSLVHFYPVVSQYVIFFFAFLTILLFFYFISLFFVKEEEVYAK